METHEQDILINHMHAHKTTKAENYSLPFLLNENLVGIYVLLWYDKLYDILNKKQFLKKLIPHIKTNAVLTK